MVEQLYADKPLTAEEIVERFAIGMPEILKPYLIPQETQGQRNVPSIRSLSLPYGVSLFAS